MELKEALRELEDASDKMASLHNSAMEQALIALREKVQREAEQQKRPSLQEMEEDLRSTAIGACSQEVGMHMIGAGERRANVLHAADLLKTLRERGGAMLAQHDKLCPCTGCLILRDLGVEAKP